MKKLLVVMLSMAFAVCQAYAQNEVDTLGVQAPEFPPSVQEESSGDLGQITALLSELNSKLQTADIDPDQKFLFPIHGKSKFSRNHLIYQTIEISMIVGKDKDGDDNDNQSSAQNADGKAINTPDVIANLNTGMNIGYSLIFIPGQIEDDKLRINRFGFGYSTGLITAFDRQDKYDVTCDFLVKFGIETGNQHPLGMGIDYLIGTGKSSGSFYFLDDLMSMSENGEAPTPYYYTEWCFKHGFQVWLKTNMLSTSIKNTDILAFARYVYSKNPLNDLEMIESGQVNCWMEESWQFGVTLRYRF